tara:strand:- start:6007 stop:6174 length:168 start_codon:yes stop_codon:yes gene_type:complete
MIVEYYKNIAVIFFRFCALFNFKKYSLEALHWMADLQFGFFKTGTLMETFFLKKT